MKMSGGRCENEILVHNCVTYGVSTCDVDMWMILGHMQYIWML